MILVPNNHRATSANRDPYHPHGAQNISEEYADDLLDMLRCMDRNAKRFSDGVTPLAKSPLRRKIWVAAAMVTLGLIKERESENGSCMLSLTDEGRKHVEDARRDGLL